jgi:hypothetical protein
VLGGKFRGAGENDAQGLGHGCSPDLWLKKKACRSKPLGSRVILAGGVVFPASS